MTNINICAEYNWKPFVQGSDWTREMTFETDTGVIPLTGWKAKLTIRDEPHSGGVEILTISSTGNTPNGSGLVITGTGGKVTTLITDVDSDAFTWKTAYYDLKLIGDSGSGYREFVPLHGIFTVIPKVTA